MNRITTLCSLAILVLGACSKEKVRGLDMPELRLTAGIEAMTRATADNNAWTGGEQVAVEATSSTGGHSVRSEDLYRSGRRDIDNRHSLWVDTRRREEAISRMVLR